MIKREASRSDPADLRRRVEQMLRGKQTTVPAVPPEEAMRLLHELQVHQIELEMQNDDLRRAQQELEASRVKYFDLYDMAPVGYFTVNEKGLILEANLRGAQLLGVGRNRLVKQPLTRYIVPKDQDIYYLHHKRLLESGARQVCELRMCRQDGSRFWARLETGTARDGEIGPIVSRTTVNDITEQKRAEALQSAIFNSASFSSIATDAKGFIRIFNVGAERMLGYTAAEVVNRITPADISDPQELIARAKALSAELATPIPPGFEALVFKASRGIEDTFELTYIRKNGSRFPAVVSVTALRDAQDLIIGYLLIGTDNTARKQVE